MVWVVIAIVCAIAGFFIGQNKGQAGLGLVLGLLLGVIGLIIIALVPAAAGHAAAQAGGPSMGGSAMGGGPSLEPQAVDHTESRLARLEALRASGALTDGEYQAQRQRVISGL